MGTVTAKDSIVATGGFVSLMEALSWIAFGRFLDMPSLKAYAKTGTFTSARLDQAGDDFLTETDNVKIRGRFVANFLDDDELALADTDYISAIRLKDFCQIDLDVNGLRRRLPGGATVLWREFAGRYAREFDSYAAAVAGPAALAEGYRNVEVCRDDLMQVFPPRNAQRPAASTSIGRSGGRPGKTLPILRIFLRRLQEGKTKQNRAEEARAIISSWSGESPPVQSTVSDRLALYYAASKWSDGKFVNSAEIIGAVEFDLSDKLSK